MKQATNKVSEDLCASEETTEGLHCCNPFVLGDLGRIQTFNLLSRNQVRYSVAPRGLIVNYQ